MQYLITFCRRPEATSEVMYGLFVRPVALDESVKLHDPSLNRSPEIPTEAVGGDIFDCFLYNFRHEVDNDVISGVAIDNVGVDVCAKFGDSRSNGFRDIRRADFVSNERT